MFLIARMSRKASAIYLSILSFLFVGFLSMFIAGLILIDPKTGVCQPHAIIMAVLGGLGLILTVSGVALTAIASNYVRKNPHKDPKNNKEGTNKKEEI